MLPLLQAGKTERFPIAWWSPYKLVGTVTKNREIKLFPSLVACVRDKLSIFNNQLVDIQFLAAAGGIGVLCCCGKGDLTTSPTLEDLLNAGQSLGGTFKRPGIGKGNTA